MKAFTFARPTTLDEASSASTSVKGSVFKAGGVDLLDRMKERVDEPTQVVWLGELKDEFIAITPKRATDSMFLDVGAGVTLAEIAASRAVRQVCPALADAASLAASPQIRQRATLGGNLLQHTRCGYYRHSSFPCWKRGDAECPVLDQGAVQDTAAIFGNQSCASAHPSSLAPVLAAHEATVVFHTRKQDDTEVISLKNLFAAPRRGVAGDVDVPPGSIVSHIRLISEGIGRHVGAYEEVRQKAAFDWSLASCAVCLYSTRDRIDAANVWLGSVAPTPWHAEAAEKALIGKPLSDETIAAAADAAVVGATPLPGNAYKVDLVKVVVRRALTRLRDMK